MLSPYAKRARLGHLPVHVWLSMHPAMQVGCHEGRHAVASKLEKCRLTVLVPGHQARNDGAGRYEV
jgi:hypothetical protein